MKIKTLNKPNFPSNINKSLNMNNSVYSFPIANKKSLSVNKFIKLNNH